VQAKQLVDKNDESGQQYRAYGKENWDFAENDLMRSLLASI
jgi:nuclear transport factor 2 (NTF2) superfamily protein